MTATITQTVGFVGNIATEPEVRFSAAGKPWMRARLSVKPYLAGAETQPELVFYDLVAFGSLAEHVADTCRKGSRIVVSGRIEDASWTGNDGTEHPGQKIIADAIGLDLRFTGNRKRPSDDTISGLVGAGQEQPF